MHRLYFSNSLPWGLFLSIGNYHITCYYRIVSSNRGDKLSGFVCVWLTGWITTSMWFAVTMQNVRDSKEPVFHFDLNTLTRNRHDNQQTAHRHRNLSLLRSISIAFAERIACVCTGSTFQPKKTYFKVLKMRALHRQKKAKVMGTTLSMQRHCDCYFIIKHAQSSRDYTILL